MVGQNSVLRMLAQGYRTGQVYLTSNNAGNPDFLGLVVTRPPFDNTKLRQANA